MSVTNQGRFRAPVHGLGTTIALDSLTALLCPATLTNAKLHSELVLVGVVGPVEGDLDLELLAPANDQEVGVEAVRVVLLVVDLGPVLHHVHL